MGNLIVSTESALHVSMHGIFFLLSSMITEMLFSIHVNTLFGAQGTL